MPNPYNITEVDVPGVLAAYEGQQDRRLQRLAAQQQMRQVDAQIEREGKTADAWGRFLQGPGGAAPSGVGAAYATEAPDASPDASAGQDYDPWTDDAAQAELVGSLATIDPKQAMELRQSFLQHSKEQREETAANWGTLASAFFELRQLPPDQRAGVLQRMTPQLRALGVPPEMIAQADLSDQGLEWGINQARDIETVIKGVLPTTQSVPGVGLYPVTPASPYPDFSNGGARADATIGAPVTGGTTRTVGGKTYWQDQNGDWYEGGGVGDGTGGF
jgi:hypothetical protein